jgi:hypothetical protein
MKKQANNFFKRLKSHARNEQAKDQTYKSWGFKEERESPRYQQNNQQNNTRKLPKL